MFSRGGNGVDAVIAANAALAVTGAHLCGLGGDLFALVHTGDEVVALNASGWAGARSDPAAMRAEGLGAMPLRHDQRSVTVPGCVDGWLALHERFGSLPLADILAPAIDLATEGFPASPLLVAALERVDERGREHLHELVSQARQPGARVRRPGVARTLAAIAREGRGGFYLGEFGEGLVEMGRDLYDEGDLATPIARWETPLRAEAFGVELHTVGPNSQGYLALGGALLADAWSVPAADDPAGVHLLVEAARLAGFDRPRVLHDRADGDALIAAVRARVDRFDPDRTLALSVPTGPGDTTYLCTAEREGLSVSLIQSNASGFGSWLVEARTGINLHNRGLGFSLVAGHEAELAPGRRPPHTLSPMIATREGALAAVMGTMGGDAQPQILLQLVTRLFAQGQSPAEAIAAPRWTLSGPSTGFDTWDDVTNQTLDLEGHAPATWDGPLNARGHRTRRLAAWDANFGHAQVILIEPDGLAGAADPRARVGAVVGW